jgi:hypothetical protein
MHSAYGCPEKGGRRETMLEPNDVFIVMAKGKRSGGTIFLTEE